MIMIHDMRDGVRVVGHYLCKEKLLQKTKAGKDYYSLLLQDKTGTIHCRIWNITPLIGEFSQGDVVLIDGTVVTYADNLQLNVQRLRRSEPGEYDPMDLLAQSSRDLEEMMQEIESWIDQVSDPWLQKLLNAFYGDPALRGRILKHPAAKSVHHNFIGGYLEHVNSVTEIAAFLAGKYDGVDRDMVIAGALLHDIGKLWELAPIPPGDYTKAGQLIGHIMIGYSKIHDQIARIEGFPVEKAMLLEHLILAHHGELEYGSPKVPMTKEAMIVHLADNTDAKMEIFLESLAADRSDSEFTEYNRILERNLYKGNTN
ncbi:MAG: HD domain-containing protein [Firmicutes bacterium]|nr:HD domain-containing protein [Bacillota bacterium]